MSAPQVSACGVLLLQCWLVFLLVGMVASTCRGFRVSLSVAFFGRWVLPDSRALGAGLPGLPGSCPIKLLPPSLSGCVQLPLPLLFITPFASLVFLKNFGFVGVDGVFGSGFCAGDHLWVVIPARYPSSASSHSNRVASWSGGSGACLPFFLFPFPLKS